jgi:flagellar motility protein MotE (MotC chaperone)
MIRTIIMAGVSTASLAVPAMILLAPSALEKVTGTRPDQNEQIQEFGTHERPWADDILSEDYRAGRKEEETGVKRGLAQSQAKIEEVLASEDLPLPAARVSSMAAVTEVLATISAEREKLAEEWARLEDQKAEVALANRRALEEIERLEDLRSEVAALIDELEVEQDENLTQVVEVVGNMTAKNAARLLQQNEPRFVVMVLDQVGERNAADILSRMQTDKANEVMAMMADRGRPEAQAAL